LDVTSTGRPPLVSTTRARIEAGKRRAQDLVQGVRNWASTPTNCSACNKIRSVTARVVGPPRR
jgi:hypothetical protein